MDEGSGSFTSWDNTKCNPLAPAREQARSAWEDGYASAKCEWVGLTPEELSAMWDSMGTWNSTSAQHFYNAIWKAIKEKNNDG